MAKCPQCQSEVTGDFGLVQCSACHAVLMFDFDGNLQAQSEGLSQPPQQVYGKENLKQETISQSEQMSRLSEASVAVQPLVEDVPPEIEVRSETISQTPQVSVVAKRPSQQESQNLSEIAEFGNSPESKMDGNLFFDLEISDIDTLELRKELEEALVDRRFQWSVNEVMEQTKGGVLVLKKLNPVKTAILVQRLQGMKLRLSWTPSVFSILLAIAFGVFSFLAPLGNLSLASSGEGGGEAAKEGSASAEGGGHGGGSSQGGSSGQSGTAKKEDKRKETLFEHTNKLNTYLAKIKVKEEEIKKLSDEKKHTTNQARLQEILRQMVAEHREMQALVLDYERERGVVKYRFPEKDDQTARKYKRIKQRSLQEIETQLDVDTRLDRVQARIRAQYGTIPMPSDEVKVDNEENAAGGAVDSLKLKTDEKNGPLILIK